MSVTTINPVLYIYPLYKLISFKVIGEKHIRELSKYVLVRAYDESALPTVLPISRILYNTPIILHPFFFQMMQNAHRIPQGIKIIGIDVADTNHITEQAVALTNRATALIVPSTTSRKAFIDSGVKVPIYVLPHGVDESWIKAPKRKPSTFSNLAKHKKGGKKIIQCWIMHSDYRKGEDILKEVWNKLVDERKDVVLALRRADGIKIYTSKMTEETKPTTIIVRWLTAEQKMELMDVCDIYLLTSRGGGFEHPPLEALTRGEPVIGAEGGAWQDWLPKWALVASRESGKIFLGNPIHDGTGVEMDVEAALNKLHDMLDNLDEYRSKVMEYVNTRIIKEFTWERIGKQLLDIILLYM